MTNLDKLIKDEIRRLIHEQRLTMDIMRLQPDPKPAFLEIFSKKWRDRDRDQTPPDTDPRPSERRVK